MKGCLDPMKGSKPSKKSLATSLDSTNDMPEANAGGNADSSAEDESPTEENQVMGRIGVQQYFAKGSNPAKRKFRVINEDRCIYICYSIFFNHNYTSMCSERQLLRLRRMVSSHTAS